MAGISTEHLAEQIGESNRRLADEVHSVGGKIDGVERRLDDFRVEVSSDLGKIHFSLESIRSRLDGAVSVAKWTVGILMPIIVALIGTAFWLTWHAAKLDSRVERIEKTVGAAHKTDAVRR
jgi:hypothetical protein